MKTVSCLFAGLVLLPCMSWAQSSPATADKQSASQSATTKPASATQAATQALQDGKLIKASLLFYKAFKAENSPHLLFNAARAAQRGALNLEPAEKIKALKTAKRYYFDYVALPESGPAGRKRASLYLREVEQFLELLKHNQSLSKTSTRSPQASVQPAVQATAKGVTGSWHKPTALSMGAASLILAALSAWRGMNVSSDQSQLDDDINGTSSLGYSAYTDRQNAIWDRRDQSVIFAGASALTAVVGLSVWLLKPDDQQRTSSLRLHVGWQSLQVRF
ncbi:MAG: hypothetical protein CMH53_02925 [Myxococcales bacterium]|nr:hypothetical protein [Myxococcales bacterium]